MKNAGALLTSKACETRAFGASLAAMLLVLFASAIASAQSSADTTASETWKSAAASAAAGGSTAASGAGAPIVEAVSPSPPRTALAAAGSPAAASSPSNLVPTPPYIAATQPGTAEISPSSADASQQQPAGSSTDSEPAAEGGEIARYQEEQSGMPPEQLKALQEFDSEGALSTPFGMQLREAKRSLKSGEEADGLLITS